jgi:hypothetical protein
LFLEESTSKRRLLPRIYWVSVKLSLEALSDKDFASVGKEVHLLIKEYSK